jgi:ABC-type phosphate transport system substrate-binding protein
MWNDPKIVELNPHLEGLLPNKSITIVYQTDSSPVNSIMTEALSKAVPEWQRVMGNSTDKLTYFPAMDSGRVVGASLVNNALLNALINLPYSFGFYHNLDVVVSRTLRGVSLYNDAGNAVKCNTTTINATLQDRKDSIIPIITLSTSSPSR